MLGNVKICEGYHFPSRKRINDNGISVNLEYLVDTYIVHINWFTVDDYCVSYRHFNIYNISLFICTVCIINSHISLYQRKKKTVDKILLCTCVLERALIEQEQPVLVPWKMAVKGGISRSCTETAKCRLITRVPHPIKSHQNFITRINPSVNFKSCLWYTSNGNTLQAGPAVFALTEHQCVLERWY